MTTECTTPATPKAKGKQASEPKPAPAQKPSVGRIVWLIAFDVGYLEPRLGPIYEVFDQAKERPRKAKVMPAIITALHPTEPDVVDLVAFGVDKGDDPDQPLGNLVQRTGACISRCEHSEPRAGSWCWPIMER